MTQKNYEQIASDGYLIFRLNGKLETDQLGPFEKDLELAQKAVNQPQDLIFQCEHLSEISQAWTKALIQITKNQKALNKQVRLVQCSLEISYEIKNAGLNKVLVCSQSVRHALVDFGLVSPRALDVNFINPFLEATMKVLSIQAQIKVTAGKIYRKGENKDYMGDISGVIGLVSDSFSGSVVVTFPAATFLKIMSSMLGETFTEINKDIQDGAAEITNMIFGHAKTQLNDRGYGIKTALPSVVVGKDHTVQSLSQGPHFVVPFESDSGPFFVEICLSS